MRLFCFQRKPRGGRKHKKTREKQVKTVACLAVSVYIYAMAFYIRGQAMAEQQKKQTATAVKKPAASPAAVSADTEFETLPVSFYVREGIVWHSRLNRILPRLSNIGKMGMFFSVILGALVIAKGTVLMLGWQKEGVPVALGLPVAPVETIKGWFSGIHLSSPSKPDLGPGRPDLNLGQIQPLGNLSPSLTTDQITKVGDLEAYVQGNLTALNASGKLDSSYPTCEAAGDIRKGWANADGIPSIPKCLFSRSGDTIWMFSVVSRDGYSASSWAGVYHKTGGKWAFLNVDGLVSQGVALRSFSDVHVNAIRNQIAQDFPYLTVSGGAK